MQREHKIVERQKEIMKSARAENRGLTPEETTEFDALQRELEAIRQVQRPGETGQRNQENTEDAGLLNGEQVAQRAIEEERKRIAEITSLCRNFEISPQDYIANGTNIDQVRAAVLKELEKRAAPIGVRVTKDEGDKFRAYATDGLMLRAGIQIENPADGAQNMCGMSLRDLAIECASREGEDAMELLRMNPSDMYSHLCRQFYNPTAAFPAILDNTIRKSIVQLYNQVPTTFQTWTTKGSLNDFKETPDHEYIIGGLGDFEEVAENGELKADVPETKLLPKRQLKTYGKQFSMTRQAFINDDIGFLTKIPGLYATKAKMTIDKQVYSILYKNNKIFDGKALFDADTSHYNMTAKGSKPSQQAIQEMILQMQKQKDPFGDAIYITPKWIIVPIGYEFDLAVILHSTQVTGSSNNDINPLYNYPINIVQTPVLNALAGDKAVPWFMVADPLSARSIQVDYLNGQETPIVRRMEAPGVLGFTWDIYTDWGIAVRDFRGISKNPGEIIK